MKSIKEIYQEKVDNLEDYEDFEAHLACYEDAQDEYIDQLDRLRDRVKEQRMFGYD